jgi:ATP-dependent RNA helicase SUPV3L1/SUV3
MQIINSNLKKDNKIKMTPEMLNLLGCSKDNFKKLLKNMNYNVIEKENEVYFNYAPKKNFKKPNKKIIKENPFGVLRNLNFD